LEVDMDAQQETALSAHELAELRDALMRVRHENEVDLADARAALDTLTQDQALSSASLREVAGNAEYMIDDATTIIARVDTALERMDRGDYGTCERCARPILFERLQLRPYATTCVPCS
jgi:RNA polymerase-binding transcription factor DksA